ncbi:MAG: hypothetical protein Q6363_010085, partial [Candidatus Njordarchaeota archaeon]
KYCPNCGKPLKNIKMVLSREENKITIIYDVFCHECEWSGDISPDEVHSIDLLELLKKEKIFNNNV